MSPTQHTRFRRLYGATMIIISFSLVFLFHANPSETDLPPEIPAVYAGVPAIDVSLPEGVGQDWWTQVQAMICASEYEAPPPSRAWRKGGPGTGAGGREPGDAWVRAARC